MNIGKGLMSLFKMNTDDDYDDDYYDDYDDDDDFDDEPLKKTSASSAKSTRPSSTAKTTSKRESSQTKQQSRQRSSRQITSKVVPMRSQRSQTGTGMPAIRSIKPVNFEEGREIADSLLNGESVILYLEGTNRETAQKIIDFVSGTAYAIDGNLQYISDYVIVATPFGVDLSGDFGRNTSAPGGSKYGASGYSQSNFSGSNFKSNF